MKLSGNKKPYWTKESRLFSPSVFTCSVCGFKGKKAFKTCPGCGTEISRIKQDSSLIEDDILFMDMLDDD